MTPGVPIPDGRALARLESARARMLDALTSASAGESLCTVSRDRLPAAKYYEGATVALGEAVRAVRRGEPLPEAATWADWADELGSRDAGWRAYVTGGREALAAALL